MAQAARYHADEVSNAVTGARNNRDAFVVESWKRCVDLHGLDPFKPNPAYIVPSTKLIEHQQQSERLIRIARSGVETLFRQVAGQNYVLLLSDSEGITVDFFGDPLFEDELRNAGLYMGADWSERLAGTCGVGSCIATGEAITVHQTDHFDVHHTPLSCTAAPIFDPRGQLAAVLDISLLRSPSPKVSQRLALNLVKASARRIELANLMAESSRRWVLRFSQSPEFLDIDPDAAVSLDDSGAIVGMTQEATRLLAECGKMDWRKPESIVGQPITRFFEFELDHLAELTRAYPAEQRLVRLCNGSTLFAHAIPPQKEWHLPISDEKALPHSLSTIAGSDPALYSLMQQVEKASKTMMPIIITGEVGTGKSRLAAAIHDVNNNPGPLYTLNCSAMSGKEFTAHYEKIAALFLSRQEREPTFNRAGTLVLEEISDLDDEAQKRLEALIKDGCMVMQSPDYENKANCRIIATSTCDLETLRASGNFREALFYRLYGAQFHLPALRERADMDELIDRLLRLRSATCPYTVKLSQIARIELKSRKWAGNFRELIATLDSALMFSGNEVIDLPDLPGPRALADQEFHEPVAEKESLVRMLVASDWNVSKVARHLGVDRSTIHRRIGRLGIRRPH